MKQITQNYKTGELKTENVPVPLLRTGGAKIATEYSLISAGTERATLEISKKNLLGKAKARPDLVKKVLTTSKKIGLKNTYDLVLNKLNTAVPLGYSLSGVVEEVADDVPGINIGDRVACAGAGYANHAEKVFVPKNLIAPIPENVSMKEAAFTTVGSIALHGVRQANLQIGDRVGVIGLGLVGQITVGLIKANGCKVFGIDIDNWSISLSKKMGADDAVLRDDEYLQEKVHQFTDVIGFDAVIITAGTDSNDPFTLAAEVLRDKGRLVVVGGIRMEIVKSVSSMFYHKEIDIKFSRSYGPGRYDIAYEEKGQDYPIGYVRWTEHRNMECFLDILATGKLNLTPLITHTFSFDDALNAYSLVEGKTSESFSGILLEYCRNGKIELPRIEVTNTKIETGKVTIGLVGAGNFAQANILPYLKRNPDTLLNGVCTAKGMTAKSVAEKFRFLYCAGDPREIFADNDTKIVFVTTRHDSHAKYVMEGLKSGKHVFVEKPLCLTAQELRGIALLVEGDTENRSQGSLMVGYNRRFAPLSIKLNNFINKTKRPITIIYRINAGFIPPDSWYQDPSHGGRFIGEGGHFVDFVQFLTGSIPQLVSAFGISEKNKPLVLTDNITLTLQMQNGSIATIVYNASGDMNMPKERIEVFGMNSSAVLDDFKKLTLYRGGKKSIKSFSQDKGYHNEIENYLSRIKNGGQPLISFESLAATSLATFAAMESIRENKPAKVISLNELLNPCSAF